MGGQLNYDGQLRDFAGTVPPEAAASAAFRGQVGGLGHGMPGIMQAAGIHAQHVTSAEQFVTQANDGLREYKQAANDIDSAYDGGDSANAALLTGVIRSTYTNPGAQGIQADMPGLDVLNPLPGAR